MAALASSLDLPSRLISSLAEFTALPRPEGHFAGKLIEDSGLKGLVMNNAAISSLHSGFIINTGGATCEEVINLITFVKQVVLNKFNVMLEEEVKIIEEF